MVKSNKPSRNLKSLLQKRSVSKQSKRGRVFETLERRELMANDFSPAVEGYLSRMRLDGPASYQEAGQKMSSLLGGGSSTGGGTGAGEANTPINLSEIESNDFVAQAQLIPVSSNQWVNVNGTFRTLSDEDYYAFDLKKGDILDTRLVAATGTRPTLALYDSQGRELQFAQGRFLGGLAFPTTSPLYKDGNTTLPYVIDTAGRYYMRVSDGISAYTLNMRVHRSTFEAETIGTQQTIYVDFDGALTRAETINLTALGVPAGTLRIPSMARYMTQIGLTEADAPSVARNIMSRVEKKMQPLLAQFSTNGYYPLTGNPGDFGVRLVSSYDSPDLWGQKNVSRVLVGGTQLEILQDDVGLLGIAQSVDVGNFSHEETTLVMLDIMGDTALDRTLIPIAGNVTVADLFAELVADTIAHEAGHTLGGVHQDSNNTTDTIMDQFYVPEISAGVGPDLIFGTRDDITLKFLDDEYSPTTGIPFGGGLCNSPDVLAIGMSTGTVGGSITGSAFNDLNRNARKDTGEAGLAGWQVYIDSNNNGLLETGEVRTTTDTAGNYTLRAGAGTYNIRLARPAGWIASVASEEVKSVTVALSSTVVANFGSVLPSSAATGYKWLDLNGDGFRDAGEPGLAGVYIYLDLDGDARPDVGEPASVSKADGSYTLTPPSVGSYQIREVVDPGYVQTYPAIGYHSAVYDGFTPLRGFDFGNRESSDWGDAPAPYATTRAQNGASAGVLAGFRLGANWDAEFDGNPSATATGDDSTGPLSSTGSVINDEDGVTLLTPIVRGDSQNAIKINVTNTIGTSGYVQGWVDFNGNGVWGDAGEQIITNLLVSAGDNFLNFKTPANAVSKTFARFRLSQTKDVGPTGRTAAGEVEDYVFTIGDGPRRNVQDDTYTVARNSVSNSFDVLANDFVPPGDSVSALLLGTPSQGGSVAVSSSNTVRYSPARGFFGQETFTYTLVYASGKRETATVTVNVTLQFTDPVAIDDSFDIPTNSVSYPLNVLVNDIEGKNGALVITGFTTPDKGGAVSIGSGGLSLRYTPARGFGGTERFRYTVTDGSGKQSTADITVHTLEGDRLDDNVQFSFSFKSMSGAPITSVTQGDQFQVFVYAYDLRPDKLITETPPRTVQDPGVYAAYLDMLYSSNLVLPSNPGTNTTLDFANQPVNPYNQGVSGKADLPGVISSLGAFTGSVKPPFVWGEPSTVTVLTFTARSAGIAEFVGDPADESPNTDVLLYNPPNSSVPVEQIRYLRSSIEVTPRGVELPFAVDDTATVAANTTKEVDYRVNDIVGTSGSIRYVSVTQPIDGKGVVSINNKGTTSTADDVISYVPATTGSGDPGYSTQFTYTIADSRGYTSTATVTLHVGDNPAANDVMKMQLKAFDLSGNPITQITVGQQFELRGYVQDLRNPTTQSGVFAAYQDVLYDRGLVSVKTTTTGLGFDVKFSNGANGYENGKSGDVRIPGLINELGSFQNSQSPLGASELLQFSVLMTANTPGVAKFLSDPADISPFHDSLLFSDQRNKVSFDKISYIPAQIIILPNSNGGGGGGSGGGEGNTNLFNRFDVNDDGFVSPIDALILVNLVNQGNGGSLSGGGNGAGGEGENSDGGGYYVDVNSDGFLSPLDILWVVNELNKGSGGGGEGESSAAPLLDAPATKFESVVVPASITRNVLQSNWMSAPAAGASSSVSSSSVDSYLASVASDVDGEDYLDGLVTDVLRKKRS